MKAECLVFWSTRVHVYIMPRRNVISHDLRQATVATQILEGLSGHLQITLNLPFYTEKDCLQKGSLPVFLGLGAQENSAQGQPVQCLEI